MSTDPKSADESENAALDKLKGLLIPGESLEAWAIQRRLFALTHRRVIVAATSGRLIGLARGLFGGFDPVDLRWQDLREAKINVGIVSATLTVESGAHSDLASTPSGNKRFTFGGLRKDAAQAVYRICQANEQSWREKRRIRDLEELRAKSGGVQFGNVGSAAPGTAAAGTGDSAQRLQQAREMLEAKLITDSEYEAIKARIINSV
jgi:hypothetical protein